MAGYSGTPLPRKLGLKPRFRVAFFQPPASVKSELKETIATDLNENNVRRLGLLAGLVDVRVCAVDEVWLGLKFVIRVKDRISASTRMT